LTAESALEKPKRVGVGSVSRRGAKDEEGTALFDRGADAVK
jgi:hypothetical protein